MRLKSCLNAVTAVLLIVLITGCESPQRIFDDKLDVLGTFADITIVGLPDSQARDAAQSVEQDLRRLDHVGYTFEAQGELHELNEAISQGASKTVSPELRGLIESARELYIASGGLLNVATGELIALWEFHCEKTDCAESPYPEEVQRMVEEMETEVIVAHPSITDLVLDGSTVSSRNQAVRLEFGDMIRGYALDKAREHLANIGIAHAMINIGGSSVSLGSRGDHPWWAPLWDAYGKHSYGYIEMGENEAIATVRAFDRSVGKQDFVYRHVIDPRTALPVRDIKAVTVIHDSALWANAAAVALMVVGIEDWASIAEEMGVRSVIMVEQDGTVYTSSTIEERIHWNQRLEHRLLVP